ncbi:sulfuric ester hydrolase [Aureococcus anophagefferens]|nr:sulfuric ester hydrolase [Aureococcus anophagefferens]
MMDDGAATAPVDDALVPLADDALDDDGAAAAPSSLANDRPDIVLITLDDVGVNDLWGSSYCSPARASLLSGKFVHRIGFSDQDGGKRELTAWSNFSVPLGHELLPKTMKRLGYATHGIGKWNIGHCNELYVPWNRGFDSWLGYFSDGVGYTSHLADQDSSYSLDGTQYELYDMAIYDKEANSI